MSPNSFDVPVPFMGGSTSNEKAVFSAEFIISITLIYYRYYNGQLPDGTTPLKYKVKAK